MNNQNLNIQPPLQERDKKKRRLLAIILILLLLLTLFSSVIVGFLIGRITDTYQGQMIDTIIIGPEQSRRVHVSGQVVYTNGSPYANGNVELHSNPRVTTTDEKGRFFYDSVEPGAHSLSIVDDSGKVLAKCDFSVSQKNASEPVRINKQADGEYAVELSVNVRFIELAVELDLDGGTLNLIPEKTVVLEDDGTLSKNGETLNVEDGVVVLPSGTVILTDKTVVIADQLILPDNSVTSVSTDGYKSDNGEIVDTNGNVSLSDGTVILPEGIKKPDGSLVKPEEPYQILPEKQPESNSQTESTAENNGRPSRPSTNNDASQPSSEPGRPDQPSTETQAPDNPPDSDSEETGGADETGESGESGETDETNESGETDETNETVESDETDDNGRVDVHGQNAAGWENWESQSTIDLFYNRTGSDRKENIQPGSKGYYLFKVENSRRSALDITLNLSENEIHLPLEFILTPMDEDGDLLTKQAVSGSLKDGELELDYTIGAGEQITYRLDWSWPYEGNDLADTIAGIHGGIYTLSLNIHAQEPAK